MAKGGSEGVGTSAVRLSSRRSPSAQFRGEVEKWKSGEEMAETVRFFPNRAVFVKSAQFRGEVEKWKSGEEMA
jgi:hypothetical protein